MLVAMLRIAFRGLSASDCFQDFTSGSFLAFPGRRVDLYIYRCLRNGAFL